MKTLPLLALLLSLTLTVQAETITPDQPPFGLTSTNLHNAWHQSCKAFSRFPAAKPLSKTNTQFGTYGDWQNLCTQSASLTPDETVTFFNTHFTKVAIPAPGKFTAYYKPVFTGTLTQTKPTQTPLLAWPSHFNGCDKIDPSPCPDREDIEKAVLNKSPDYKPLIWLDDPTDAYLLHIQGSGTVMLPNGEARHVGFAGKNGHPYVAIGKVLKDWGELTGSITIDKIRGWIDANPQRRSELFHNNPSYIFFRESAAEAPGAFGIPLTSGRSLAVDRSLTPLGLPLLISTTLSTDGTPFRRITFAQDVGSAIKGPARADIYLGHGSQAGSYAGDQNSTGQLFYLLPKTLVATIGK